MSDPTALLLLGVEEAPQFSFIRTFNLGGLGTLEFDRTFDIVGPPASSLFVRQFWLGSKVGTTFDRVFWLGDTGPIGFRYDRTFDIIDATAPPAPSSPPIGSGGSQTTTTTTAPIAPGDITITVAAGPFYPGQLILIGGVYRTVIVGVGAGGGTITLSAPVGATIGSGATVTATPTPVTQAMAVFDKAGRPLGLINSFTISRPRSISLRSKDFGQKDAMEFYLPIVTATGAPNPDLELIQSDRLVALQSTTGGYLWAGTMTPQEWTDGMVRVSVDDLTALLEQGPQVLLTAVYEEDPLATTVAEEIVYQHNVGRGPYDEVQWQVDFTGVKRIRGDSSYTGDAAGALDAVVSKAHVEYATSAFIDGGGNLVPVLVMRDKFQEGAGVAFTDGPGGNIAAPVRVIEDPSDLVHEVVVRGTPPDLSQCLPDSLSWAVPTIQLEATASVAPGDFRRRTRQEVTVDWGLSSAMSQQICLALNQQVLEMYLTFLKAHHDILGRPYHEGYFYEGDPDKYSGGGPNDSLSRRTYRHRLQMVEVFPNEPAVAVALSSSGVQNNRRLWLVVRYDHLTEVQTVNLYPIPMVGGGTMVRWEATGPAKRFKISGGRVVATNNITIGLGGFAETAVTRVWYPAEKRYRSLHRIVSGMFAINWAISFADDDIQITLLDPEADIDQSNVAGGSLISTYYDFEMARIGDWDPRRDGVGEYVEGRETVFFSEVTTRGRWHIVPFNAGDDARTALTQGVMDTDTLLTVESIQGFPADEGPFMIRVTNGIYAEDMEVVGLLGTDWTVNRAQNGTNALVLPKGAVVQRIEAGQWEGFLVDWSWPEGQAYADELLAEGSVVRRVLNLTVANVDDTWQSVGLGTVHDFDVQSEGRPGEGFTGTARVLGFAPDDRRGTMEVVVEEV